ncbi:discoidin domain-containing protein [Micromonospora purpureochromogenes]|uniref:discoidin domain-containing protein n=1 Tax=Micromonospora purpureochromogenes TaxID=47872 RepID=UPI00332563DC
MPLGKADGGRDAVHAATVYQVKFTLRHAGAGGEDSAWNTRDFDLQVSTDGSSWTTVVPARGNTADVSNHPVSASGRYVRLKVPQQDRGIG